MKIKQLLITLALLAILVAACTPITESTGKVLDNAGSVTRSVSEKAWVPNTTPTPTNRY